MSLQGVWQECFSLAGLKPVVVVVSDAALTSDAGLLPIRQFDVAIALTRGFACVLNDERVPARTTHTTLSMVRTRLFGIIAGYEDQNDHDTLRNDPKQQATQSLRHPSFSCPPFSCWNFWNLEQENG